MYVLCSYLQVTSREDTSEIISLGMVDLIIPRGSSALVKSVIDHAQGFPVLGHAEGICHVYVDTDADLDKALHIGTFFSPSSSFVNCLHLGFRLYKERDNYLISCQLMYMYEQ